MVISVLVPEFNEGPGSLSDFPELRTCQCNALKRVMMERLRIHKVNVEDASRTFLRDKSKMESLGGADPTRVMLEMEASQAVLEQLIGQVYEIQTIANSIEEANCCESDLNQVKQEASNVMGLINKVIIR